MSHSSNDWGFCFLWIRIFQRPPWIFSCQYSKCVHVFGCIWLSLHCMARALLLNTLSCWPCQPHPTLHTLSSRRENSQLEECNREGCQHPDATTSVSGFVEYSATHSDEKLETSHHQHETHDKEERAHYLVNEYETHIYYIDYCRLNQIPKGLTPSTFFLSTIVGQFGCFC